MNTKTTNWTLLLLAILSLTACDKDDPIIPNEEELITTLRYELTPDDGGDVVVLIYKDLDGDGALEPTVTVAPLAANRTYQGNLTLLDESQTDVEDITVEILEEDDEHQFFFTTDIVGLSVGYSDQDGDGNPVGLSTTVTTGAAGSGSIMITLIHEPMKNADGVAAGNIANAGGETDIAVTFDLNVQ